MDIIDFFEKTVKDYSEKNAVIDADNNRYLTYRELFDNILYYANIFRNNGISEGQKVAICLNNSLIYIILLYSLLYLKAIPVLIDSRNTLREIKECLESSDAKIIIFETINFDANALYDTMTKLFFIKDRKAEAEYGLKNEKIYFIFKDFTNKKDVRKIKRSRRITDIILFTYRGSGKVLPVLLSENALVKSILSNFHLNRDLKEIILLLVLPIHHILALTCNLLSPLSLGVTVVLTNTFKPYRILNIIEEYKITYLILVPTMVYVLLNTIKKNKFALSSLKNGIVGGNKFQNDLHKEWHETTNCKLLEGYGLTETCPVICNQWDNDKPGSIGKLMKGVNAKITGEKGNLANAGEEGSLWIKSDMMLSGYLNNDELNKEFIVKGWFNTGDIASRDSDGFYYFVKTGKNIAKVGGSTVDLSEVKSVIESISYVSNCTLSVQHDRLWNDRIVCSLTSKKQIDKTDIYDSCRSVLATYKIPGDFIINIIQH